MAKRKAWQRALSGLGVGMANVGETLARRKTWEDQQDRLDERASASAEAVSKRGEEAATRAQVLDAIKSLGEGADPEQVSALIGVLTGRTPAPGSLDLLRPSPRRRMEQAVGGKISGATSPESIPDDSAILSAGRRVGLTDPIEWPIPGGQVEIADPYVEFTPEVREYGDLAKTRRRTLENAPTEKITGKTPEGADFVQLVTKGALAAPFKTSPTSAEQGRLAGTADAARLGASGEALAKQAGAERKAVLAVENAPEEIQKRIDEARKKAFATESGNINARVSNSKQLIELETQKALAQMQLDPIKAQNTAWGEQIAKARESASSAVPILGQLRKLFEVAQPEMEAMFKKNPKETRELAAQLAQGIMPRGALPTNVRKYVDLLEAARPRLARAMGNVGNFTEGEQARAGYIAPDFFPSRARCV